jgi:hypothetical protein
MIKYVSRNSMVGQHCMTFARTKRQVSGPRSSCGTVQGGGAVDAPGMISSYGTYQGVSGARVIGAAGCLKGGGTGPRAQRTMQLTGSH